MDLTTITSVASAIAALLAALYASHSARSAAKSLVLMQRDRSDKDMGITAYLIDTALFFRSDTRRSIALASTLTNLASVPNSISAAELHIHEYTDTGAPLKLILRPTDTDLDTTWDYPRFVVPLNLDARSSTTGWLVFDLPDAFGIDRAIDRCELWFSSAIGERTSVETYLLREVQHVRQES